MALTAQQKTEIFQLTQTMFNAAPGTQFYTLFENYIAATGASAREFAIALAGTPAFRQVMYADSLSSSAFASQFMDNLVGSTVATAHKAGVASVIVNLLGQGVSRGEIIYLATSALAAIPSDNPDWGAAAAQLRNKVAVAEYYTTTKGGAAVDLSTIQAVTAGVTDSAASVTAAKARLDGTSGRVADGYIKNATVFADLNGDGVQNAGEISTTTDNFGNFTLTGTAGFGRIVVSGGTDISTNLPFNGTLTATAGATVVNPLTTLVQTMVASGGASSAAAAQTQVLTALGISTDVDLNTFDPLDAALNGDNAAAQALGAQVQAAAAQVANIMVQGAAVLQGGNSTLTAAEAMAMVAESLASALDSASGAVDLAHADFMESMMTEAAQAAGMDAAEIAMLDDVASAMADAAAAIDEALAANPNDITAALSAMAQAQIVAQGDMADAMLDAITAGDFSDVMETFTGDAFDDLADAADAGTLAEGVDAEDPVEPVVTPPAGGGTSTPSTPSATTQALDSLTSTHQTPATFNAGTGAFNFTDAIGTASFVTITNFGADDAIALSGLGSNSLIVANYGADVILTVNNGGIVSQITLVGVTTASAIIGDATAFNALSVGNVTY